MEAYKQAYSPLFTDDASVVESIGKSVFLTQGSPYNIKITKPEDLVLAKAILNVF
jgi:2-C-methyl-D-erythritol 4-phosphate cytidylyltransferase